MGPVHFVLGSTAKMAKIPKNDGKKPQKNFLRHSTIAIKLTYYSLIPIIAFPKVSGSNSRWIIILEGQTYLVWYQVQTYYFTWYF